MEHHCFDIRYYYLCSSGVIASSREHKKLNGNMGAKYCLGLEFLGVDSRACMVFHKPRSGKDRTAGIWRRIYRCRFSR